MAADIRRVDRTGGSGEYRARVHLGRGSLVGEITTCRRPRAGLRSRWHPGPDHADPSPGRCDPQDSVGAGTAPGRFDRIQADPTTACVARAQRPLGLPHRPFECLSPLVAHIPAGSCGGGGGVRVFGVGGRGDGASPCGIVGQQSGHDGICIPVRGDARGAAVTTGLRAPLGRLHEVAPDIHAFLQPPGSWCLNNAGVIAGRNGVVLVDTAATRSRAEALRTAAEGLGRGAVRLVVNTHSHGDHVFGNCVFAPPATIVAHELTGPEIAAADLGLRTLWPDVEWGELSLRLPTVTFGRSLTLLLGDRVVELYHVGPAHTTNDVVVWIPDVRVLFTGDVVLPGCTPFCLMGSVRGSLAALDRLRNFGAETVIGGHGRISGPEVFDETERYLRRVLDLAAEGVAEGMTPLQIAGRHGLGEFGELLDSERLVGNLHRAVLEIERPDLPLGSDTDVFAVFEEMIDFNGRCMPACLA
ncbi:MBL fold metallo-hydrolase [Nocardia terpenica]|nr:MBL fold metallo-hydrolase [Nocardia terpenica]